MSDEHGARAMADMIGRRLAADDKAPMDALFAEMGLPPPTLRWNPTADALALKQLRFLLDHWNRLRGARPMPSYREIDPLDLRPVLGWVSIIEAVDGGRDFVYRVYGTATAARMGVEMTGRSLWTAPVHPNMRIYHAAAYVAAHQRAEPLFTYHVTPTRQPVAESYRLILPLANGEAASHLLVGIIAGADLAEAADDARPAGD